MNRIYYCLQLTNFYFTECNWVNLKRNCLSVTNVINHSLPCSKNVLLSLQAYTWTRISCIRTYMYVRCFFCHAWSNVSYGVRLFAISHVVGRLCRGGRMPYDSHAMLWRLTRPICIWQANIHKTLHVSSCLCLVYNLTNHTPPASSNYY